MVSRINIGPDGGPYIAINENSGDIELEDNAGNVVAEWDDTNARWDFQNNQLVNSNTPEVEIGPDGGPFVSVNENAGDIELKDNSGTVVAKWDESATQWDFVSNDLTNVGVLEAGQLNNDAGDRLLAANDFLEIQSGVPEQEPSNTTSTSFEKVVSGMGVFDFDSTPPGTTPYGLFVVRARNSDVGETITIRPRVADTSNATTELSELEVSGEANDLTVLSSGWVELTSVTSGIQLMDGYFAKVSGGTGDFSSRYGGLLVGWKVD
jgi:hypothetical protein